MLGTAFPASRVLLVEQPGPWGRDGLRSSRFDRETAATLVARAAHQGVRVEAVRQHGRTPRGQVRRWALADTRDGSESIRWGTYDRDADLLDLSLDDPGGALLEEPVYLVCAHSKHDACCALRGRPVAAALAELRPGLVLECSHLGGDRFAANVLVLPSGLLYGRVLPFAAPEFVRAAEAGEVIPGLLRGRIGLLPVAQAAVAFCHEHLGLRRRDELTVESVAPPSGGQAQVRLRAPSGPLEVTVLIEHVEAVGLTCADPRPGSYLRYRPTLVESA